VFVKRRCGYCGELLPLEAFNNYRGGKQHWCRECFRAYFRARGDVHLQQVGASQRNRKARLRCIVLDHLRANPCTDCGETDVRVLEFDHIEPRIEYVSRRLRNLARPDVLRAEIRRCEVVCANCHRRRTAYRANWKRLRAEGRERLHRKPFIDRNLRWLYGQLAEASCVDCGLSDPVVLEYDHVGDKRGSVTRLAWSGYSRATLKAEIAQCEVRCASCHRRRTVESRGWFRSLGLSSKLSPP